MRSQEKGIRLLKSVVILATALLFAPATGLFAQESLFDSTFIFNPGPYSYVYAVTVQDDGKILIGGHFSGVGLLRLHQNGKVDTTFTTNTDSGVYRFLKQPDGKILVAGIFTTLQGIPRQRVGRLLTNGAVDLSFDAGAFLDPNQDVSALGLQSDGKVLVGTFISSPQVGGGLMRLNADGQVDSSFVQTNVLDGYYGFSITARTNGSILIAGGFRGVNGFSTPGLALLNTNGQLDTSFISPLQTNTLSGVYTIAEQPDSRLVIGGGFFRNGSTNRLVLARLTDQLAWDDNFHPDVVDPTPGIFYSGSSYVMSVVRQPDGKLLLGGQFQEVGGYWRQSIARVSAEGRVDPCFDPGIGLFPMPSVPAVSSMALQSDGKVLVAGPFYNPVLRSDALTRFLPQSECGAIRVRMNPRSDLVAGTCTPGGTNHLQWSTNLVNWETAMSSTSPFVYGYAPYSLIDQMYFRVKKEY